MDESLAVNEVSEGPSKLLGKAQDRRANYGAGGVDRADSPAAWNHFSTDAINILTAY